MTAPLAGVRTGVATALSALGIPVHKYPTGAMPTPCAYLVPGSPYLTPGAAWGSSEVGLDVRIVVSNASGAEAMERLDALVDTAVAALIAASIGVDQVGAPYTPEDTAGLAVDIPTTTVWKAE
jgi:hypothetical protein